MQISDINLMKVKFYRININIRRNIYLYYLCEIIEENFIDT